MSPLNRKLVRELWQLKGQIISISLVVAVGIMSIVTMRGSFDSLLITQQQYYRESRFADLWVSLVRAPQNVMEALESIPGVNGAESRVSFLATLDLDDSGVPAHGLFVSIPDASRPALNDLKILRGRYIDSNKDGEVIISENFADARGFQPGDSLRAIINGRAKELSVVGIGVSPEHAYAVPPGGLYPEDDRYGIFWVSRNMLGPAFDMEGAFNEAFFSLTPDTNEQAVINTIDEVLKPYGGLGAYTREDQPSHVILQAEIEQNRVTGAIIPMIFLAVAVYLLYLVLGRMISTQRGEIAVLKAFGYSNKEVGTHFLMFAVTAVTIGGIIGTIGGLLLGDAYVQLYGQYFKLPDLAYIPSPRLLLFGFLACVFGAFAGSIAAVYRAAFLPPAEAMRPEAPVQFSSGLVDRWQVGKLLGTTGHMIFRNFERKAFQNMFSILGIAMAVAILTMGFFLFDSIQHMMDLQFRYIQKEDIALSFREQLNDAVRYDLENIEGVNRVETHRTIAGRLRNGHLEDEIAIQGLEADGHLRRIINAEGKEIPLPTSGLVISTILADRLSVAPGDNLIVEFLEGKRRITNVPVHGLIEDYLGLSVYMDKYALWQLSNEPSIVNGAFLSIDEPARQQINTELKGIPIVSGVTSPANMLQSFEEQMADGIFLASGFLLGFAGVIAAGVIYNAARITLSERGRELASLRVMGFQKSEVATLLLGEQAIVTVLAIPLGWLIGSSLSYLVTLGIQTDIYRIPFVINIKTYLWSGIYVFMTAIISGWIVKMRLDQFELVEVLKTRE